MKNMMIDLETLGTNVDSQILSIGAVIFDIKTGDIEKEFYRTIKIEEDVNINATLGTIKFWLHQAANDSKSVEVFNKDCNTVDITLALSELEDFYKSSKCENVWANGTKFDLGMLEYQYKKYNIEIPWNFNSDRCMRTLRNFAGVIEIASTVTKHNSLNDARWQTKYVCAAVKKLGLLNSNNN